MEAATRLLEALKPSPPPNDPLTLWLNDMCDDLRKAFQGMPLEQIPPRLAAAGRAIELFEAHELLAAALANFNAAMPKGAPKIAQGK
jgi:hypothetical protein